MNSLSTNSKKQYLYYWNVFSAFVSSNLTCNLLDCKQRHIEYFVAHLHHEKRLSVASIRTYLSAIAFHFQSQHLRDPTKSFIITAMLKGYGKHDPKQAIRRAITSNILIKLQNNLFSSSLSRYYKLTYFFVYFMMYHAALRVSEICFTATPHHALTFTSVHYCPNRTSLILQLCTYKHSNRSPPPIVIHCTDLVRDLFLKFIRLRGNYPGQLFCHPSRDPITRDSLVTQLRYQLSSLGYDPLLFNTHSFRIGKITDMHREGKSELQIRSIGRWSSSAYLKYIKPTYIVSN